MEKKQKSVYIKKYYLKVNANITQICQESGNFNKKHRLIRIVQGQKKD